MDKSMVQVNVQMDEGLAGKLDEIVEADFSDRSKVIRRLIAQEHERRSWPTSVAEYAAKERAVGEAA